MDATATLDRRASVAGAKSEPKNRLKIGGLVDLYQPKLLRLGVLMSYLSASLILFLGWASRGQEFLTAESGLGYVLGIVGGTLMLLLLLYPLRKKARFMSRLGPIKYWFRLHMTFGVLGPMCILFHSNFQLGSLNSNVALFCMLIVAGSGLIGRYLYMRIHNGLYGSKVSLGDLRRDAETLRNELAERIEFTPHLLERLEIFEAKVLSEDSSILVRMVRNLFLGFTLWRNQIVFGKYLDHEILKHAKTRGLSTSELRSLRRSLRRHIAARMESVRKIAGLGLYEKLFSAWHLLHFPLFLMLVLSGLVHVFAVHVY